MRLWFRSKERKAREEAALRLYHAAVARSRSLRLYGELNVPDTLDGRFDMLVLHLGLVLARLAEIAREGDEGVRRAADLLAQEAASLFAAQMDDTVREIGVGDLSVGKHVKNMSKSLYGRMRTYHGILAGASGEPLGDALIRNVWAGTAPADEAAVAGLAAYTADYWRGLQTAEFEDFWEGRLDGRPTSAEANNE